MLKKNLIPIPYLLFLILVLSVWFFHMYSNELFGLFANHIGPLITMVFGSFIAGSSPEGSAAIAYPIFTLYLDIEPEVARNFAFAIQSIGMTAASVYILSIRMKLDWAYIRYVSLSGLIGLIFGTYYIVPLVSPAFAKLFFVSLWLSFGIVLWLLNRKKDRVVHDQILGITARDILVLMIFGFIGGIISSIFGTGINIFTFCLMVIYFKISEKVATPSSIIIMTIETIAGLFLHAIWLRDMQQQAFEMWLVCIPVVIFFAPLGSYMISKISRIQIARLLYSILIVQYIGAMWVLKPGFSQVVISVSVLLIGLILFRIMASLKRVVVE